MPSDKVAYAIKKAKAKYITQQVLGWIITILCGLIASSGAGISRFRETADIVIVTIFAIFTALGILLIVKSKKRKKLIKNYYDYSARLSVDPNKSLDLLSSSIGTTTAIVTKNISNMIALGFFPDSYIDTAHNSIVMSNEKLTANQTVSPTTVNTQVQINHITVQCKGCGATNKLIAGTVGECEFCGSQISGK